METTQYMESITGLRSIAADEQSVFEGTATVSLETQADLVEHDYLRYVEENTGQFIRLLRWLTPEDQELLLSYYLLSKTQNQLAIVHISTQTICSFRIRMAMQKLGTYMLFGGPPTVERMAPILTKAGVENSLRVPLSKLIDAYAKTRNFQHVADVYRVHRPDIRRAMSRTSKQLMVSPAPEERALAAYIHGLCDKASASGQGYSKRKRAKVCHIFRTDPMILGEFCINVADPNFEHVYTARAEQ